MPIMLLERRLFFFDPKDPKSITTTVLSLLDNPSEMDRLKKEGMILKSNYSYTKIAEQIVRVLELNDTALLEDMDVSKH